LGGGKRAPRGEGSGGFPGFGAGRRKEAEVEAEARRKVLEMGVVSWRCGKPVLDRGPLGGVGLGW
jgi:hypothetical protein